MGQIYQNLPTPFSSPPPEKENEEVEYHKERIESEKRSRAVKILVFALVLVFAFFHYFIYWDPGNGCYITIKPAFLEFSNLGMKRALRVIKYGSPKDYQTVCRNVSTIEPFVGCGGFGGGCFYQSPEDSRHSNGKEISVSTSKDDLITTAAVILHETCHAIQEKEGRSFDETECYKEDDRLLRDIVAF